MMPRRGAVESLSKALQVRHQVAEFVPTKQVGETLRHGREGALAFRDDRGGNRDDAVFPRFNREDFAGLGTNDPGDLGSIGER